MDMRITVKVRHMNLMVIAVFFVLSAQVTIAQKTSVEDRRQQDLKMFDKQWKEMEKKDPAGWAEFKTSIVLDAQQSLARFGYGTVFTSVLNDKTRDALRNYQKRNRLPTSGDIDVQTWMLLRDDESMLEASLPFLPTFMFLDSEWNDFVKVEGVWLEQGKEPDAATPNRTGIVECTKSVRICIAATTSALDNVRLEWFEIERWDEFEIATKPSDLPCGRETIRVTRPDKTLLVINTAAYKNVEACTKLFGTPTPPMVSRLGDGMILMNLKLDAYRAASDRIKDFSSKRVAQ
jgi:hypothetical protein